MIQCPDCGNYNKVEDNIAAYAYECWCCLTPHWLSEDHMYDYMTITGSEYFIAQSDLENRTVYFADSEMG